jgi:hypothetical protein
MDLEASEDTEGLRQYTELEFGKLSELDNFFNTVFICM